jgi:hypothetical protein
LGSFIDQEHQHEFQQKGYIVLPALSIDTVAALKNLYNETFFENNNPRSNFNAVSNQEINNYIRTESMKILASTWDKVFTDYRNNGATLVTKDKHQGELGAHEDITLIDTKKDFGCYAWIPLQDVTEENGCMFVVEKSHLFFDNYVSFTYKNENIPISSLNPSMIHKLEMKVGEVLFFNNRLYHGSFPNKTNTIRVALNALITSKEAPLLYYQKKDEHTASEYFVTTQSFLNSYKSYSQGLLPDGAIFSKDIPYSHIPTDSKRLNEAFLYRNKIPFWARLKMAFHKL